MNKRRCRISVESLESRALLSTVGGLTTALNVSPGNGSVTLTMTETNTSSQVIPVSGGAQISDFWVIQSGVEVWRYSRNEPQPMGPTYFGYPLKPGASRTFTTTWRDDFPERTPPYPNGPFMAISSVDGIWTAALIPSISAPKPALALPTILAQPQQPFYRAGRAVTFMIVETNRSTHPIAVGAAVPSSASISRNGVLVWQAPNAPIPAIAMILPPGQSRVATLVWPGRFNVKARVPSRGVFTLHATLDGVAFTSTVGVIP